MLVATYAKQTGRVVAYSMAAFRQAFAAGRDLGERDTVLIAAAAAEMHPAAVIKAAELRGTRRRLDEATAAAAAAGVRRRAGGPRRRRACSTATASSSAPPRRWRRRREGEPRVRADRPPRRARARPRWRDPERVDQVEIVEIATGEVALFWDTAPAQTGRLVARAQGRPRAARRRGLPAPLAALGSRAKAPPAGAAD